VIMVGWVFIDEECNGELKKGEDEPMALSG
jgi:hypothetical protein